MLGLLLLCTTTFAAPAATLVPAVGPRSVKIDLFSFDPRVHPWGSDWKVSLLDQWTAVLSCSRDGKTERCRFVDGVWWSVIVAGSEQRVSVQLPAPGEIELVWSPRGRLQSWDVIGDRTTFWTEASNAQLKHTFHRPDVVFKPDSQREIGASIERSLTRGLAAALEWELPKNGDPASGWKPSQTPWIARRWIQSVSSPDLKVVSTSDDGSQVQLAMSGSVSERASEDISAISVAVVTTVAGTATYDRRSGIVRAHVETVAVPASTSDLVGYARTISLVEPWAEGGSTTPAAPPEVKLP